MSRRPGARPGLLGACAAARQPEKTLRALSSHSGSLTPPIGPSLPQLAPCRLLSWRLATLRGADPCMQGACSCSGSADEASSAAERQHRLELQQKQEAAEGLRCKLLARGLGPGTLAALCSDAEHSAVAGGAAPAAQQQGGGNGESGDIIRVLFGLPAATKQRG